MRVIKNRELLAGALGFSIDNIVTSRQEHGNRVRLIDAETLHSDLSYNKIPKAVADAMITRMPYVCLTIIIADCVPVLLHDTVSGAVGIAHAGWKGTIKRVAQKTVRALTDEFGSKTENIRAGIGPSIGPCCYEVGQEVIELVEKNLRHVHDLVSPEASENKGYFDLWKANEQQLIEAGIPQENIEKSGLCTACNHNEFFSYRHHGRKSGRMAAGIMIKPQS